MDLEKNLASLTVYELIWEYVELVSNPRNYTWNSLNYEVAELRDKIQELMYKRTSADQRKKVFEEVIKTRKLIGIDYHGT
jgi:hypothetical protein